MKEALQQIIDRCRKVEVPPGARMLRLNLDTHSSALYFGRRAEFRFDSPDGQFGVLYAAEAVDTAFAETFGHDVAEVHGLGEVKFIGTGDLDSRRLFEFTATKSLQLADFTGAGLVTLNLDADFVASKDYGQPQAIAKALYEAGFQGIRYHSRALPSGVAYALFDNARDCLTEENLGKLSQWSDPLSGRDIYDVLDDHGWSLMDSE